MSFAKFDYLYYYTHNPSTEVPQHLHSCHELVYYLEGTGETYTNGVNIKYNPHQYIIYTAQSLHNEVHFTKTMVLCVGFLSTPQSSIKIKTGIYNDEDRSMLAVIERIKNEVNLHQTHYNIMSDLLVSEFLIKHDRQENKITAQYDEMHHIKQFINENIAYDMDVDTLAELSGYSYHYFRHMFKLQTGLSPKKYIINKRIEYAQNLLAGSSMAISDIAQASGFSKSSQFNVAFKKYTSLSPARYRKQQQSNEEQKDD